MPQRFVHDSVGARVIFGAGRAVEVPAESRRLGHRLLSIADEAGTEVAAPMLTELADELVGTIGEVRPHVPIEDAERARALARSVGADCLLAIGGGSTMGLAKAIAMTERLPIVAVPTTYAGSEMTPVWGLTADGVKRTGRDPIVAPRTIVYDPELTLSLPPALTAASGLNAVAHCVDALWAPGRSPLTQIMAERGIAALVASLPAAMRDGRDLRAREAAMVGAWLAGATFAIAGSSLHHKLCHMLGGKHDLPHAETHAVVLPWTTGLAIRHMPEAGRTVARALGTDDPVAGLRALAAELGAPTTLAELGLTPGHALAIADEIDTDGLGAPFSVTREELHAVLAGAAG